MSREDFLRQLDHELRSLSAEERANAMEYYEDYLADADDVSVAIDRLGSPQKVAATILREVGSVPAAARPAQERTHTGSRTQNIKSWFSELDNGQRLLLLVLALLALICITPFSVGAFGTVFGILITIFAVLFAVFLILPILSVAFFVCAGVCFVMILDTASTGEILILVGGAFLCLALAFLFLSGFLGMCRTTFPTLFRGIASCGQKILHPKGGASK